jgi:hypothetical protein
MARGLIRNNIINGGTKEFWSTVEVLNKSVLQRFFRNVDYLCRKRGISRRRMKADIERLYGFKVSYSSVSRFLSGKHRECSVTYLNVFCLYLNEPFSKLIGEDYLATQELIEVDCFRALYIPDYRLDGLLPVGIVLRRTDSQA